VGSFIIYAALNTIGIEINMPELYPEDQKRVNDYLASMPSSEARKPFKLWRLLGVIFLVLGGLTVLAYGIARSHGVV
jgi:hypothetical protein